MLKILLATIAMAALTAACAQTAPPTPNVAETVAALSAAAIKAYQAKDYATFLADEKKALALEPGTPRLIYNVACGEALQGNAAESVHQLDALLALKIDLGGETDDDFAHIRNTSEWAHFLTGLAELRKPIVRSQIAFQLDDVGLTAAGIAVDPATGDTFIASVRERKILRRTRDGSVRDFISSAQDGFQAGASLAIDPARKLLYASTSTAPFMLGFRKEDTAQYGLFAFDFHSGKLVRKVWLPADGKPRFLNDLAIDRAGNVYISDSLAGGVYLLRPRAAEFETLIPTGVFRSTQGLAFSDDEKTLYISDYSDGLWGYDLRTKTRRHIDAPNDIWLSGLDGLSRVPGGFIAVQNGVQPNRVLRLVMDEKWQRIAKVEILESNRPDYNEPIQGAVAGHSFLYVANSQLGLADQKTGAYSLDKAKPALILKLPL